MRSARLADLLLGYLTTEHGLNQSTLAALTWRQIDDIATVAQDRGPVAHPEHLGQPMCDEEHRPALIDPCPHHGEHVLRLVGRKGCGDLVEHEDLRVVRQGAGEIYQPKCFERELTDETTKIEVAELHRLQPRPDQICVDPGQSEVLFDGQVGDQRRVLEHRGQTGIHGFTGVTRGYLFPLDGDGSRIRREHPGENLDQRALPGTVGTEQRMDLPRSNREVHRSERHHGAKAHGDAAGFEKRIH